MSISIRNPKVEILAREIAAATNSSMTQVIIEALEEKKKKLKEENAPDSFLINTLFELSDQCASLPDLDQRTPDEILGYDRDGGF